RESTTSRKVKAMVGALEQKESNEKTNTHRMSVHPSLAYAKGDVGSATKCFRPQRLETTHACDADPSVPSTLPKTANAALLASSVAMRMRRLPSQPPPLPSAPGMPLDQ